MVITTLLQIFPETQTKIYPGGAETEAVCYKAIYTEICDLLLNSTNELSASLSESD